MAEAFDCEEEIFDWEECLVEVDVDRDSADERRVLGDHGGGAEVFAEEAAEMVAVASGIGDYVADGFEPFNMAASL